MAKVRIAYHFEKITPGQSGVHVYPTQYVVADAAVTSVATRDGFDNRPTEAAIRTALSSAGISATGPNGSVLRIEGYSAA